MGLVTTAPCIILSSSCTCFTVARWLVRPGLRAVPLHPPCGLQVNAVKSQAVEGDKALIMADLIQVRLWALLWRALHCTGSNRCSSSCMPSLHPGSCRCLSLTLNASAHPALSPADYLLRRPR